MMTLNPKPEGNPRGDHGNPSEHLTACDVDQQTPASVNIGDPWLARYCHSKLLRPDTAKSASNDINAIDREVYGESTHPILFRIGNGGAGYTGVLQILAERFISTHGNDFRIGWVTNHSRHSQVALLADIVQVALTYEPHNEDLAIEEGWCRRVCRAFNDHFILAGPASNAAQLQSGSGIVDALQVFSSSAANGSGKKAMLFHTRGDGSATYAKEQLFWSTASVSADGKPWYRTEPRAPYQALEGADKAGAYLLTDRATYLTAKRDGAIPNLRAFCEGGSELLNPCSALVNTKVPDSAGQRKAVEFVEWLGGEEAQGIVGEYGRDWSHEKALFTVGVKNEFDAGERLIHLDF